jgi:hypothetical protein
MPAIPQTVYPFGYRPFGGLRGLCPYLILGIMMAFSRVPVAAE